MDPAGAAFLVRLGPRQFRGALVAPQTRPQRDFFLVSRSNAWDAAGAFLVRSRRNRAKNTAPVGV